MYVKMFGEYGIFKRRNKVNLNSRKAQKILFYLILNSKRNVSFDEVMKIFFEGYDEKYAKKNLNTLLYMIRKELGLKKEDLSIKNDLIYINIKKFKSDFLEFQKFFDDIGYKRAPEKVLSLYEGELLRGLDDEWVIPYRKLCEMQLLLLVEGFPQLLSNSRNLYKNNNTSISGEINIELALKLISLNVSRRNNMFFPMIIRTKENILPKIRKSDFYVRISSDTFLVLFESGKAKKEILQESLKSRFDGNITFLKVF
ncbi:MAG: hypothetical protein H0Z24_02325 [Thermosipho sp. (in: Bacteria)]|nr:hypothetical protein [Thermosipho sp. (in: thermotogales)]